jgi:hypothetical protein
MATQPTRLDINVVSGFEFYRFELNQLGRASCCRLKRIYYRQSRPDKGTGVQCLTFNVWGSTAVLRRRPNGVEDSGLNETTTIR